MNQQPLATPALKAPVGAGLRTTSFAYLFAAATVYFVLGAQSWAGSLFMPPWDKVAHFVLYSVLTAWLISLRGSFSVASVFALVVTLGMVDEMIQMAMPGRSADFMDWLTDGCAAALTCVSFYANQIQEKESVTP